MVSGNTARSYIFRAKQSIPELWPEVGLIFEQEKCMAGRVRIRTRVRRVLTNAIFAPNSQCLWSSRIVKGASPVRRQGIYRSLEMWEEPLRRLLRITVTEEAEAIEPAM